MLAACSVLDASIVPGALQEDAPHRQCGGGKEMSAPIPLLPLARHAQVRFVDEGCGLKGLMRLPLASQSSPRELSQFVIDFRHEVAG